MAERPWATPEEVKEYSDIIDVQDRDDARLKVDILRAEEYVIKYTNNDFSEFEEIPESVKTAVILLAEAYGCNSRKSSRDIKSETYDDYSYSVGNGLFDFKNLGLNSLLDKYVKEKPKGNVIMRMMKL